MQLKHLAVASALLLAGVCAASAETMNNQAAGGGTAAAMPTAEGQCWDQASNTVRSKSGSASGAHTPGGVTTGAEPSGQSNNDKGTGIVSGARPQASANLPAC
jgi:hypothetical protein